MLVLVKELSDEEGDDAQETASCLWRFLPPFQKPGRIFTDILKEFIRARQELQWTHDTNTPHRVETKGIAERTFRREMEQQQRWFTVAFPKNGRTARWNVVAACKLHDEVADGRTAHVKTVVFLIDPVRNRNQLHTHLFQR